MMILDAITAFAEYQRQEGRAEATTTVYARELRGVFARLQAGDPGLILSDVTPTLLYRAVTEHVDKKAPATSNRAKAAVRAFCTWAHRTEQLRDNIALGIHLQRAPRTPPAFLTDAEVRRLVKCLTGRKSALAQRDRTLIETFLATGIRLHELVMLDIDDVDLDAKHLRIRRAKGGQPQVKFLNTHLRGILRSYLQWRKKHGGADCPALFISQRETRLSPRQVGYRFAHWLQEAGIEKPITPHGLRHTFATRLYSRTGDLLLVQRALGHRQLATTEIYTHLVDGALEEALERL